MFENNRSFKVLIVDDVSTNIQMVANILKDEGYQMAYAQGGEAALAKAQSHLFDLILLDVMMPRIDGFEVCRRLKQNPATADVPVVFLTAKGDAKSIAKGFEPGGLDYVTKPFRPVELLARVKTRLELKRSREELILANQKLKQANEELLAYQKQLELTARTDSLTKLSNRRDMTEKIENESTRFERSGRPFSLILCDIDDFKLFNDKYGHDCGDFVLVAVAETMRARVRKQDCVARWGRGISSAPAGDGSGGRENACRISQRADIRWGL